MCPVRYDADAKDGGLQSLEAIRDQFGLNETLTATTQSDGQHAVYAVPAGFDVQRLRCWIRVLPGLDLKVDARGYIVVEPSRGGKGVYRWRDFSAPIVPLPVEACEYLIATETANKAARVAARRAERGIEPRASKSFVVPSAGKTIPIPNQARFFRDVRPGDGQHARLLTVGVAARTNYAAPPDQVEAVIRWHGERFSAPFTDERWIGRTVAGICAKYERTVRAA